MDERRRYERGMSVRRQVLGAEHVEQTLRRRTELDRDLQDLITRYAWGEIWTRPGLTRRTRSLITLAALVALNRSEELAMHLRAALRNGVTRGEIREVLLQMAIYCGLPAANSAMALAAEVLGRKESRRRGPTRGAGSTQSGPRRRGRR